jgi:thiosulfate dehydrogenase [quinone] large subunit
MSNYFFNRNRDIDSAYGMLRATLGVNICIHGISRLLVGPSSFAGTLVPMFDKTFLPAWSVYGFGLVLPWTEALLGLLLLIGLRTRIALLGGSLLILTLTFGSTLRQDWNGAGLQLIYAGVYAVLLAFLDRNFYSLDTLLSRNKQSDSLQN